MLDITNRPKKLFSRLLKMSENDIVSLLTKCINFAAIKHKNQRRKDKEQTPYINHPIGIFQNLSLSILFYSDLSLNLVTDNACDKNKERLRQRKKEVIIKFTFKKLLPQ